MTWPSRCRPNCVALYSESSRSRVKPAEPHRKKERTLPLGVRNFNFKLRKGQGPQVNLQLPPHPTA